MTCCDSGLRRWAASYHNQFKARIASLFLHELVPYRTDL